MTKINKLGKSTFVIAILSFILVAVLAFGGTYAYFSAASTQATGKVTTGRLKMSISEDTVSSSITGLGLGDKIVQPGQLLVGTNTTDAETGAPVDVPAALKVTMDNTINYYIRVKFDVDVKTKEGATHNGVISTDNPLTEGTNEGEDDTEAAADAAAGNGADKINIDNQVDVEGDNVSDDIAILEILLKVAKNADIDEDTVAWKELTKSYQMVDIDGEGEGTETERRLVDGHTGYFYGTGAHDAAPEKHTYDAAAAAADGYVADYYNMQVLVNVQDWVGAYGCQYYMDAEITIKFQIEVLQADFLDNAKLGVHWGTEEKTAAAPTTIAELHEAWDLAVALDQN